MNDEEEPAGSSAGGNQAAIDWAWSQEVVNNPGARVALLCLARRVDESWECTASQEEVAVDAMVPARSMRRYLEALEEGGWIVRRRRMSDTGSRLPDSFRLNPGETLPAKLDGRQVGTDGSQRPNEPVANMDTGSDQQEPLPANMASGETLPANEDTGADQEVSETRRSEPVANMAGRGGLPANMATGETAKPQVGASGQIGLAIGVSSSSSKEEEQNLSTTKGGAGGKRARQASEEHPRFAEWYAAYPLHDKRPQAVKAFNKALIKVGDPQILIDGAKRYAERDPRVARGFIKGPSVWLNNDCWDDQIPPDPQQSPGGNGHAGNGKYAPGSDPHLKPSTAPIDPKKVI